MIKIALFVMVQLEYETSLAEAHSLASVGFRSDRGQSEKISG